jgi:hypothetical protein
LMRGTHRTHRNSMNKLVSSNDLGCSDKLFIGYLAASVFLDTDSTFHNSLEGIAAAKQGAHPCMFLPDSATLADMRRKRQSTPASRLNEQILGEVTRNLEKVDQSLNVMTTVENLDSILGLGGNLIAYFRTVAEYDVEKEETEDTPLLHTLVWQIMLLLFSEDCHSWRKKSSADKHTRLAYWLFTLLSDVLMAVFRVTHDEEAIALGERGDWSSIDTSPYWQRAQRLSLDGRIKLVNIFKGAEDIPLCLLYEHSAQYRALKQNERQQWVAAVALSASGSNKRARLDPVPAAPAAAQLKAPVPTSANNVVVDATKTRDASKRGGDVIYKVKGLLPVPTYPDGLQPVCAGDIRNGTHCRSGGACGYLHGGFAAMSAEHKKVWIAHVAATADLEWNTATVTPAMLLPS